MSVYFAKVGRYIKVGFSENPERRVRNLFKSSTRYDVPFDLDVRERRELLLYIPGQLNRERACHEALEDFAAGCEWFIDEPPVREFMAKAAVGVIERVSRPEGEFVPVSGVTPEEERRCADIIDGLFKGWAA